MRQIFTKECFECHSHNIFYDEHKGELFCFDCGLILDETFAFFSIEKHIQMINTSED